MKHKLFKSWLMLVCLLFGVGTSWAESITVDNATKVEQNGITIEFGIGDGSTAPKYQEAGFLRLYAKNTITISCENAISGISFDWTKNSSKAFASVTASIGTYNHPSEAGKGTWSGSAKSIVFTVGDAGQIQIATLEVTVGGSSTPTPATYNVNVATVEGGTISASPTSATADTEVTLTATPADGYEFGSWNVTNASTNTAITVTDNKFKMPAANVNVSATFNEVQGGGDEPGGDEGKTTGTITFGTNNVKINAASVTGDDDLGNTWTITTEGTTSFTSNSAYYQVGASKSPATSITFTTTLPKAVNITNFSAKFGGFSGTAGTVTLKVGETTVGTGSLDAANDVTISSKSAAEGSVLTVTLTDIDKGVKCYNISYTYDDEGGTPDTPATDPEISNFIKTATLSLNVGDEAYDVRECLNIPSDYDADTYAITTTINGLTQKDGEFACVYPYLAFQKAGTYTVAVKAAAMPGKYAETTGTITVTVKEPEAPVVDKTIAEFIASEGGKCYLTGIVSDIKNTTYGNFTLTDESGSIYIYGCLTPEGEAKKFNTLDVVEGDKIKVLAEVYELYLGTHEAKNVIFVEEFEIEKAQYTVTIEAPENGTLVVKNGETVLASGDKVEEGTTLTVACTPASEDYRYKNWQYKEDGNWVTMTTTMTRVVTQDISIRANFEAIPVYAVNWSVNGEIVKTENVKDGAEVSAPEVGEINEKVFTGWVTSNTVDADKTPEYVKPATATADATYYAVFATEEGSSESSLEKLNASSTLEEGDDIVVVAQSGDKWYVMYQETISNSYVKYSAFDHEPTLSDVSDDEKMSWTLTESKNSTWILGDDTNGYLFNENNNLYVESDKSSELTIAWDEATSKFTIKNGTRWIACRADLTGDNQYKFRGAGTQNTPTAKSVAYFDIYRLSGGSSLTDFTTLPIATTVISITTPEGYSTFMSKKAVVMPEGLTGSVAVANGEELSWNEMYKAGDVVPALTPILVKGPEAVADYDANVAYGGEEPATNYLYANTTDAPKPASEIAEGAEKFYVLSYDQSDENIGFYWLMKGGASFDVPAGRVFLAIPGNVQAKAAFRLIEESTGINAVKNANAEKNAAYNLNGQRVNANAKGIVIVNGKKVLNK